MQERTAYRSIFKATSLFGGVQIYVIIIQIIRSKVIAVLLGPTGIGIQGLLTSALELIKQITAMGLYRSAVRDVSEAYGLNNDLKICIVTNVVRQLVWLTGLLGTAATLMLSPWLSKLTFGNYDYTIPFVILSITLLFDQLSAGQKVILQGTRRLKELAKASVLGVTLGLIVSIPLYFLLGIKGIVPTLVLNSLISLLLSWYFSSKVKVGNVSISSKDIFSNGATMLRMGIAMSVSGILEASCSYVLRGYIRVSDGPEMVGLYAAGFAIINTYVGMIFTAIGTDYYPRLAAINEDNEKSRELINQQGEVASLILTPLLLICEVFMPLVIWVLYSDKFLEATGFILFATGGMFFRLASWLIAYQFVAKGESKLFMYNELSVNIYSLIFSLIGYDLAGLTGIGIAFVINYVIYFIQVYIIAHKRYSFTFTNSFRKLYFGQLLLIFTGILLVNILDGISMYMVGILLIFISVYVSVKFLTKQLDIAHEKFFYRWKMKK